MTPDVIGAVLVGDVGVEAEAGIEAVAGVDLAGRVAPLGGAEELAVRGRGGAVAPGGGDRQRVVGVDDPGQRRLIGFGADVGVGGPDQLVAGDAVAGLLPSAPRPRLVASARMAASSAFSFVAALAGAQVGEGGREAGRRG